MSFIVFGILFTHGDTITVIGVLKESNPKVC